MSSSLLQKLLEQTEQLTTAERLTLAARLIEDARRQIPGAAPEPQITWREVCGMLPYPAFGEDAQEYISRSRREGQLRRTP
jgi:hypothetical protein